MPMPALTWTATASEPGSGMAITEQQSRESNRGSVLYCCGGNRPNASEIRQFPGEEVSSSLESYVVQCPALHFQGHALGCD